LCADGFTGFGDFVLGSPSCTINIMAVQGMWAMVAISHVATLLVAVVYTTRIYKRANRQRKLGAACAISSSASFITLGCWRAADPLGTPIGTHAGATILFCLGASCFWMYSVLFTKTMLEISLKQARMNDTESNQRITRVIDFLRGKGLLVLAGLLVLVCWFPIFMLATTSAWTMYGLGVVHYMGLVIACLVLGVYVTPTTISPIVRDMQAAITRARGMNQDVEQLTVVAGKLDRLTTDFKNQAVFNVLFASPFGLWPLLQHLSCYWLPVAFTASALVSMQGIWAEMPVRKTKSSVSGHVQAAQPSDHTARSSAMSSVRKSALTAQSSFNA
jgi:hypothetical protein